MARPARRPVRQTFFGVCVASAMAMLCVGAASQSGPQAPAPTTPAGAPSTAPATRPGLPELSPVVWYSRYIDLAHKGEREAMLAFFHVENDSERLVADAVIGTDLALARLARTTFERFGEAAVAKQQEAIGDARVDGMTSKHVSLADVELCDLIDAKGNPVASMIAKDGKWKIYVSPAIKFWGGADKLAEAVRGAGVKATRFAEEVAAGKYASADDLIKAIRAAQ